LRIFGTTPSLLPSIDDWNRSGLWRCEYIGLEPGLTFFAEDSFGNQFALDEDSAIVRFLAETGEHEPFGMNVGEWLEQHSLTQREN